MDWKKKLKFVFITSAFAVLILIVLSNVVKMTQVSEKDFKTYRQGLEYLNKKDYENAYFNFSNVSRTSAIYEIALLRQALCADELNDSQTASKKFRMFIEKYPESMFVQKAYYALAQNYFREKEYTKAEKTFNDIKKNFKDSEYKTASNYYLGVIYKQKAEEDIQKDNEKEAFSKKIKAKNHFIQYIDEAPTGRFAMSCITEINQLKTPLDQRDYFVIGQAYYKNGALKFALDNFNKAYMSSCWGYLSIIYTKLGDYKKASEIFDNNYPKYSQNLDDEALYKTIENYASICPQGPKEGWNKALAAAQSNNAKGEDFILYRLTKYENTEGKNLLYTKIYTKFPNGNFASDAVANLFWQAYINKQFQEALRLGQIHARDYQNTIAAPKVLYWMGKLTTRLGNKAEAKGFYQKILEKYPDDYYAFRASKQLSYSYHSGWQTKSSHRLVEKSQYIPFPAKHTSISDDSLKLITTILKLNDYKLLGEIDKENKAVQSWLNYREGKYATSALLARDVLSEYETKPPFSDSIYKLAYQLHYQDTINDYAKFYRLDPYLVTALIREESYFNHKAGSAAGARGLMQLMPATAAYIARRNGIRYAGADSLYNPTLNIELGCAYLDYAKERLHEDDLLAVASYNGGPNAVLSWKDTLNYRNFDEFIENIPYPETRDYVKKVYRSYWVYLNVY